MLPYTPQDRWQARRICALAQRAASRTQRKPAVRPAELVIFEMVVELNAPRRLPSVWRRARH